MSSVRINDSVIPAQAGIQPFAPMQSWIPAYAGMTNMECVHGTRE
jgi:hypothetical protein